jgi:hypothetical protein
MSKNIELFNIFVKGNLPMFRGKESTHVFFCAGIMCRNCTLAETCKTVPALTIKEYKQIIVDYPEYMI